jgi:hypothetical protein
VRVIVDNSTGADHAFATRIAAELRADGFDTEIRHPDPDARFDTSIRVTSGVAVRLCEPADQPTIARVAAAIRRSEEQRTITRRRFRPVPIVQGEGRRALAWVDALG